ncbi:DUF6538 domain-containing protein [Altererythrobacter fulvus]|uniref:DUF6538 domain-containing protein n=1 Tax=Caenibius fulvus TaxID=2126012 RepID=UPI003018BFEE
MCSYLRPRNGGVYYTRMVVPPRLRSIIGKSDLGRSLKTKDRAEAKRLLPAWLEEAQSIIAAAERELADREARAASNAVIYPMTQSQADWEDENAEFWQEFERRDEANAEAEEALEARLSRPVELLSENEAAAKRLLRSARYERDRYRERYYRRKRRDAAAPARIAPSSPEPAVTITGMFEGYASQDGINEATARQFRAIIKHLVAFLGHDDAKAVTLPDLARWREHLLQEPMADGKPRSAKTINGSYLAAANVVFSYGLNMLLIAANPTTGLAKARVPKVAKLREKDFTKAERRTILAAALLPTDGRLSQERAFARRWVPWLCAYTGARVNEMTQIRKEDIQKIDGVWTVRITPEAGGVKTNEARTVPLHEHLIDQGFVAAISGKDDGPLFYDPDRQRGGSVRGQHKKVGMFLAQWVRDLGVNDPNVQPNHAWRHTFKGICLEAGIEERAADYMQGHASKGQGRKYGSNTIPALANQLAKFPRFEIGEGLAEV